LESDLKNNSTREAGELTKEFFYCCVLKACSHPELIRPLHHFTIKTSVIKRGVRITLDKSIISSLIRRPVMMLVYDDIFLTDYHVCMPYASFL